MKGAGAILMSVRWHRTGRTVGLPRHCAAIGQMMILLTTQILTKSWTAFLTMGANSGQSEKELIPPLSIGV